MDVWNLLGMLSYSVMHFSDSWQLEILLLWFLDHVLRQYPFKSDSEPGWCLEVTSIDSCGFASIKSQLQPLISRDEQNSVAMYESERLRTKFHVPDNQLPWGR